MTTDDAPAFPTYPAGTPLEDVTAFDRGQKVVIQCKDHPGYLFASKDPYVSNWFPADQVTADAEFRGTVACKCRPIPGQFTLATPYTPTRNG